ncbi:MAG: polyphosphate kinase 2 family protein [Pseudomonadales bacterium]|nr:polyphosphate kinase 2 family protein [Pseudomonadales bacterium]
MVKIDDPTAIEDFVAPFRIEAPAAFRLTQHDPGGTGMMDSDLKEDAKDLLAKSIDWMAEQQAMLAARERWSLLLIFQARDAAGKDSTIKHVMTGINPQGCQVTSFKHPGPEVLDHDYLWRYHRHIPGRGDIGIFNRSYYEEVLIVRLREELLRAQKLPDSLITESVWRDRFEDINNFERYLTRNGVLVVKFFLNVSKEEQKQRFIERLEHPEKHWKFSPADIESRRYWDDYTLLYEEMIRNTSTAWAPWFVIPADKKWFTRLLVASVVVGRLHTLGLSYPEVDDATKAGFKDARALLDTL